MGVRDHFVWVSEFNSINEKWTVQIYFIFTANVFKDPIAYPRVSFIFHKPSSLNYTSKVEKTFALSIHIERNRSDSLNPSQLYTKIFQLINNPFHLSHYQTPTNRTPYFFWVLPIPEEPACPLSHDSSPVKARYTS